MIRIRTRYDEASGCSRVDAERGYVMRLFGYFGGPQVLDALVNPLGEVSPPENAEQIRAWSQKSVTQIVRATGTAAAAAVEVTGKNGMQLIQLARRLANTRKTEAGAGIDDINQRIAAALACLENPGFK